MTPAQNRVFEAAMKYYRYELRPLPLFKTPVERGAWNADNSNFLQAKLNEACAAAAKKNTTTTRGKK
jgi:hypothetical protein